MGQEAGLGWEKIWTEPQDSDGFSLTVGCVVPLKTHCILPCPSETGMCQVPMWLCLTLDHALSTEVHHLLCPRKGTLNDNLEGNPSPVGGVQEEQARKMVPSRSEYFPPQDQFWKPLPYSLCSGLVSYIFQRHKKEMVGLKGFSFRSLQCLPLAPLQNTPLCLSTQFFTLCPPNLCPNTCTSEKFILTAAGLHPPWTVSHFSALLDFV